MKRMIIAIAALLAASMAVSAQEGGIPEDVFYLMPEFSRGTLVYQGQSPVQGTFNICAVDNTVRFKDSGGQELAAVDDDLVRAVIDNVTFIRKNKEFYRLYPISDDVSVAVLRRVLVMNDTTESGYGGTSQTTSVSHYNSLYTDGSMYKLEQVKEFPYRMSETASLCKDGNIMTLTKKNFQKCFPGHKDEIEAWFKANKKAPTDLEALEALCRGWSE